MQGELVTWGEGAETVARGCPQGVTWLGSTYLPLSAIDLTWAAARKEGETKGRQEGRAEGLREAITTACDLLGIELTQERRELLATLQADALARIVSHLRVARSWPES